MTIATWWCPRKLSGSKPKTDESAHLPAPTHWKAKSVVVVGLSSNEPTAAEVRYAAGAGVRLAGKKATIAVSLPGEGPLHTLAAIEGALLGGYRFSGHKAPAESDVAWQSLIVRGAATEEDVSRAVATAESVWWVRDRVNTPPNELYPESFTEIVQETFESLPVEVEVWDETRLAEGGFGGLLGVGGGSERPPRLVAIRYPARRGNEGTSPWWAKASPSTPADSRSNPPSRWWGMKYDMTGCGECGRGNPRSGETGRAHQRHRVAVSRRKHALWQGTSTPTT